MRGQRSKSLISSENFLSSLRAVMSVEASKFSDPWTQNPFVRSAVQAIYSLVASVPLRAVKGLRSKPDEAKPLGDNDPLSVLLARPNPIQDGGELCGSLAAFRKLEGAAYVVAYGASGYWTREEKSLPRELLPVDPRAVSVDRIDPISQLITMYRIGDRVIPADSVIVWRDFNPRDLQSGSSSLLPVWSSMEADRLMDVFASALLNNGANPGTLIKLGPGFDPQSKEMAALREQFDSKHRGAHKAGRTAVVGAGVDMVPFPAQTARDMQAFAMRADGRDRIKAVLGVTDFEVGRTQDFNNATATEAGRWLWRNTIIPILSSIENKLWSHIFEPLTRGMSTATWAQFDLSKVAALKKQYGESAQTASTLIATGFDPEQVAEKLELGLDFVALPELPADPPADPPAPVPVPVPVPDPAKSFPTIIIKRAKPKPVPRAYALRIQNQWADHAERKLGRNWRKFTAERYAETIRLTRNLTDLGQVDPSVVDRIIGDAAAWRNGAKAAAEAGLKGSGKPLVGNMEMELGGFTRIDVGQEVFQAAATRRVAQMVNVGDALRLRIRASINQGIVDAGTDGIGIDGLETILEQRFGGRLPSNAATVARTEVGIFSSDVRRGIMVAEGVDLHEWAASSDEHTREDHRQVDGERKPLGERFSNGLLHPLESGAPAAQVINCRCIELPYLKEADE